MFDYEPTDALAACPEELILMILTYCDSETLRNVYRLSSEWYQAVKQLPFIQPLASTRQRHFLAERLAYYNPRTDREWLQDKLTILLRNESQGQLEFCSQALTKVLYLIVNSGKLEDQILIREREELLFLLNLALASEPRFGYTLLDYIQFSALGAQLKLSRMPNTVNVQVRDASGYISEFKPAASEARLWHEIILNYIEENLSRDPDSHIPQWISKGMRAFGHFRDENRLYFNRGTNHSREPATTTLRLAAGGSIATLSPYNIIPRDIAMTAARFLTDLQRQQFLTELVTRSGNIDLTWALPLAESIYTVDIAWLEQKLWPQLQQLDLEIFTAIAAAILPKLYFKEPIASSIFGSLQKILAAKNSSIEARTYATRGLALFAAENPHIYGWLGSDVASEMPISPAELLEEESSTLQSTMAMVLFAIAFTEQLQPEVKETIWETLFCQESERSYDRLAPYFEQLIQLLRSIKRINLHHKLVTGLMEFLKHTSSYSCEGPQEEQNAKNLFKILAIIRDRIDDTARFDQQLNELLFLELDKMREEYREDAALYGWDIADKFKEGADWVHQAVIGLVEEFGNAWIGAELREILVSPHSPWHDLAATAHVVVALDLPLAEFRAYWQDRLLLEKKLQKGSQDKQTGLLFAKLFYNPKYNSKQMSSPMMARLMERLPVIQRSQLLDRAIAALLEDNGHFINSRYNPLETDATTEICALNILAATIPYATPDQAEHLLSNLVTLLTEISTKLGSNANLEDLWAEKDSANSTELTQLKMIAIIMHKLFLHFRDLIVENATHLPLFFLQELPEQLGKTHSASRLVSTAGFWEQSRMRYANTASTLVVKPMLEDSLGHLENHL